MEDEKNAFYVVRKGDNIGIYNTFADAQSQLPSSVCDPSVSVFKGYGLTKEAEKHLASHGLKGAAFSIGSSDVKADTFGQLVPCPVQQPALSRGKSAAVDPMVTKIVDTNRGIAQSYVRNDTNKMERRDYIGTVFEVPPPGGINFEEQTLVITPPLGMDYIGTVSEVPSPGGSNFEEQTLVITPPLRMDYIGTVSEVPSPGGSNFEEQTLLSCTLMFDGASKGNPGLSGAGAVLRSQDGCTVIRLREGVGFATNNVAEYRALILGLKYAIQKGCKHIRAEGDSKLVCNQVQGLWKINHPNLAILCKEAKELKDKFTTFQINHVLREFNSEADAQANLAVKLRDGQVEDECIFDEAAYDQLALDYMDEWDKRQPKEIGRFNRMSSGDGVGKS